MGRRRRYFDVYVRRDPITECHRLFVGNFRIRDYGSNGTAARRDLKLLTLEVHRLVERTVKTLRERSKKTAERKRKIVWPGPLRRAVADTKKSILKTIKDGRIHILFQGQTLCDFSRKLLKKTGTWVPRDWPPGNLFVSITESDVAKKTNCISCIKHYALMGMQPLQKVV